MSEREFLIFPASIHHFCLCWVQPLDIDEPVMESLSFPELPTCVIYDTVKPTDHAVRTEGSLLPPHTIDAASKPSSLEAVLENGQISEFLNPAKVFFIRKETECAEMILLARSWILIFFFRIGHHLVILCNSVFCLKSFITATSSDCR